MPPHPCLPAARDAVPGAAPPDGAVRKDLVSAREYIRLHVTEAVSLHQLARVTRLSKFHFQRLFTTTYGVTPRGYQMRLRLDLARQLLLAGAAPASVAYRTGFADQSHFTRRFKRHFGVTPGAFARAEEGERGVA